MNGWKVAAGAILSIVGFGSLIAESPVICTGALFIGPIFLIWGLFESSPSKSTTYQTHQQTSSSTTLPVIPEIEDDEFTDNHTENNNLPPPPPEYFSDDFKSEPMVITSFLTCGEGHYYKERTPPEIIDELEYICDKHGYNIDCFIDQGGMSEIYIGHDYHGSKVIIKRARGYQNESEKNNPYPNAHEDCVNLIRQEAEFLKSLNTNPYIVSFIDFIDEEGEALLIEEFVDGLSLKKYVKARKGLSLAEASLAASQILDVITFIHSTTEYVYRDLQPTNIMVKDGHIVVIDFGGVAKVGSTADQLHYAGYHGKDDEAIVGTWLDTYSFSNILFFMITGKDPPKQKDRGNVWKIMEHELKKKDVPDMLINAIEMSRDKKITSATQFKRFFRALAYGDATIICGLCTSPLQPGASHCVYCGSYICKQCSAWRSAESTFCGECGYSICHKCSKVIPSDSTICMYCGEVM